MSEHPNAQIAREAFDAMARGDVDWLQAHMHPDVVFHQGGRFPTAGTYEGRDAVFGHMMEFFALVDFSTEMWGVPKDPYAVDEFFAAAG